MIAHTTSKRRPGKLACMATLALWLTASVGGFAMLVGYTQTPGALQRPPLTDIDLDWPTFTPYRLVLAIHPKCVCSRATAGELARIFHHAPNTMACKVLMYQPASASDEFGETWLMERLTQLPHTIIEVDIDGQKAAALGMHTSGSVVLYGPDRKQRFYGGITVSRGHEGNSVGAESILSILQHSPPATTHTPVYGCPLQKNPENELHSD